MTPAPTLPPGASPRRVLTALAVLVVLAWLADRMGVPLDDVVTAAERAVGLVGEE